MSVYGLVYCHGIGLNHHKTIHLAARISHFAFLKAHSPVVLFSANYGKNRPTLSASFRQLSRRTNNVKVIFITVSPTIQPHHRPAIEYTRYLKRGFFLVFLCWL